jgi:hypothetical protein
MPRGPHSAMINVSYYHDGLRSINAPIYECIVTKALRPSGVISRGGGSPLGSAGFKLEKTLSFLKLSDAMSLSEVNYHLHPQLHRSPEGFSPWKTQSGPPVQAAPTQSCQ